MTRLVQASPHTKVREDWLALSVEDVLDPHQPIFDAHHHLWDRPEGHYRVEDLLADTRAGHDVRASLYVQCRTGYRNDGPEELHPLGEVETILRWGRGSPAHPAGIIGFADLQLGDAVRPVLDALIEAAEGRLVGIRNTTAWHPDPAIRSNPRPPPDGLLRSDAFLAGARAVRDAGLALDIWAYQSQLREVLAIARAVPDLRLVVDHCGGPLGVGPYRRGDAAGFRDWEAGLSRIAEMPQTRIKIGGFGLNVAGYDYATRPRPAHSRELAADWAPWVETCIDLFGAERSMFESNFPVDKGQFGYVALWNAFKRLSKEMDEQDRHELFWRAAIRCYCIAADQFH